MARTFTQVAPDSTGDKIAAQDIVDGTDTVLRQEVLLADPTTLAGVAKVGNAAPGSTDYGLVTRQAGDPLVVLNGSAVSSATTLATQDTSGGYGWWQLQLAGAFSFTLLIELSDDNTNWQATSGLAITTSIPTSNASSFITAGQWWGFCRSRYIRARISSFTSSASGAVTLILRSTPPPVEYINVNVSNVATITGAVAAATPSGSAVWVSPGAYTGSGGFTSARVASAATTNLNTVKASAGNLYSISVSNQATYDIFLKLFDKASNPVLGTDTPKWTIKIPAGLVRDIDRGMNPIRFTNGIAYAITKLVADSDATAVALDDCHGILNYA